MRDSETPSVFSPGTFSMLAPVTTEPDVVLVAPGFARMLEKKSSAVADALHGNPFTFTSASVAMSSARRQWHMRNKSSRGIQVLCHPYFTPLVTEWREREKFFELGH